MRPLIGRLSVRVPVAPRCAPEAFEKVEIKQFYAVHRLAPLQITLPPLL